MSAGPGFRSDPLEEAVAVGRVEARCAQLWMRTRRAGPYAVHWWPEDAPQRAACLRLEVPEDNERDNTCAVSLPGEGPALAPLHRYRFRVTGDDRVVGEGRFETAPEHPDETPERFSFGIMSCNQPFDAHGYVCDDARRMLRATRRCLEEHDAKMVFMMGDQMYADFPQALSLFNPGYFETIAPPGRSRIQDCTAAEVRRIYQQRYRHFWDLPEWAELFAHVPCYPILDDHDIVDNWGSDPAHQEPAWRSVGEGARRAYYDYQGTRVLPPNAAVPSSFHYSVTYGHTAAFVLDLRSERRAGENGRLFSEAQEADLVRFLQEHRTQKVLLFVLSVPIIHVPRFMAAVAANLTPPGEDFSDRWSSMAHVRDRDRFLELIHRHQQAAPEQRIVFLSGDIHAGCVHEVRWAGSDRVLYQFISSGITHRVGLLFQFASTLLIRLNRGVATRDGTLRADVRLLKGIDRYRHNPYGRLNLGIVEIETPATGELPRMRFKLYGHEGDTPRCVYCSPWV